jgi:hypothetical protein
MVRSIVHSDRAAGHDSHAFKFHSAGAMSSVALAAAAELRYETKTDEDWPTLK